MRASYLVTLEVNEHGNPHDGGKLIADLLEQHRRDMIELAAITGYELVSVASVEPMLSVEEDDE